jgi:galactokinase
MRATLRVSAWNSLLTDPDEALRRSLGEIYGPEAERVTRHLPLWRQALEGFARHFSSEAEVLIARAPGRVNLLGMHIDHRGGAVNTMGVGDTILVAEPRDDDLISLANLDERYAPRRFRIREELPAGKIADWDAWTMERHAERLESDTAADWSNYVRAAVLYLQHLHTGDDGSFRPALRGMNLFVAGNLRPSAGLSSSSSVVVAAMEACIRLNALDVSSEEMVEHCAPAEWYVGTRGGGGDHAAIKFARPGTLTHIGSHPLTVRTIPFPPGHCAVLCDSLVVAAKTAGARNTFNQRVAGYELGLLLLKERFPERAARMEHLRDVKPATLEVDEGEIYQMLKELPESIGREEVSRLLPDRSAELERIFRSHQPEAGGYRLRQVCLYGIAECLRSELTVDLLEAGDVAGFGELITVSHDGDRVSRRSPGGGREPLAKPLPDGELDRLTAEVRSPDPARRARARLHRQPGGYDASCPELDEMVEIAVDVPGALGAGLVGAGLGGCMVALTREESVEAVSSAMEAEYYRPRSRPAAIQVCRGAGGSGVISPG